jgi:hypothetical protein
MAAKVPTMRSGKTCNIAASGPKNWNDKLT